MTQNDKEMKKHWKTIGLGVLCWAGTSIMGWADPPDPPPMPGSHGQNGNVPVGAPIDGGLGILLALGATYGCRKAWMLWKEKRGT